MQLRECKHSSRARSKDPALSQRSAGRLHRNDIGPSLYLSPTRCLEQACFAWCRSTTPGGPLGPLDFGPQRKVQAQLARAVQGPRPSQRQPAPQKEHRTAYWSPTRAWTAHASRGADRSPRWATRPFEIWPCAEGASTARARSPRKPRPSKRSAGLPIRPQHRTHSAYEPDARLDSEKKYKQNTLYHSIYRVGTAQWHVAQANSH